MAFSRIRTTNATPFEFIIFTRLVHSFFREDKPTKTNDEKEIKYQGRHCRHHNRVFASQNNFILFLGLVLAVVVAAAAAGLSLDINLKRRKQVGCESVNVTGCMMHSVNSKARHTPSVFITVNKGSIVSTSSIDWVQMKIAIIGSERQAYQGLF